jgi:hypothetical protein
MSMSGKMCSLGCSDLRSISRYSIHDDRNSCQRTGVVATILTGIRSFVILTIIAVKTFVILTIVIGTTIMPFTVLSIVIVTSVVATITTITTISTMVWCSCGSSSGRSVSREVGSLSSSDLWGVVDGQGCSVSVGYSCGIGVSVVARTSAHRTDSHQAEQQDLKDKENCDYVCFFIYLLGYSTMLLK